MKFAKTRNVLTPTRANANDAGIDFYIPWDRTAELVYPNDQCIIDTGIKVDVPPGYALVAFNKSGIATKKRLLVGACVVDSGYQGTININLHNVGTEKRLLSPGDKIIQFLLLPLGPSELTQVPEEHLYESETDRGEGKFGSTGN
jgi:dUTP pyrophosphatase|tara:strand:- start:5325 stop:5759 length:435 start_codon:yes stop_codon:yes gene_type:complete